MFNGRYYISVALLVDNHWGFIIAIYEHVYTINITVLIKNSNHNPIVWWFVNNCNDINKQKWFSILYSDLNAFFYPNYWWVLQSQTNHSALFQFMITTKWEEQIPIWIIIWVVLSKETVIEHNDLYMLYISLVKVSEASSRYNYHFF